MTGLEQGKGVVKRATGNEISCLAILQTGQQGRHVVDILHAIEFHLDSRVSSLESRNDLLLPQYFVIRPPALYHQLTGHQLTT